MAFVESITPSRVGRPLKREPRDLTARELEVLAASDANSSHKAAATALGISPRTFEAHLHTARIKLAVRATTDAVDSLNGGTMDALGYLVSKMADALAGLRDDELDSPQRCYRAYADRRVLDELHERAVAYEKHRRELAEGSIDE